MMIVTANELSNTRPRDQREMYKGKRVSVKNREFNG